MRGFKILLVLVGVTIFLMVLSGIIEQVNYSLKEITLANIEIPEELDLKKTIEHLNKQQMDSMLKIEVTKAKIEVLGSGMGGYAFYMWHQPLEKGEIYIRAFEITKEIPIGNPELSDETRNLINSLSNTYQVYKGVYLIHEGALEIYYPVRFELWFRSAETGKEKKLTEKSYLIDGWDR